MSVDIGAELSGLNAPMSVADSFRGAATELAAEVVATLNRWRFRLDREAALQKQVFEVLLGAGFPTKREVRLGPGDRVDVFVGPPDAPGVGVEAKIKGQRRAVYRQCARYCGYARIQALVLVTNLPMGFPEMLEGKPVFVVALGQGWL